MTKSQIILEVETSDFQPRFSFTDDIDSVVDDINRPHEDYFLGFNDKVKEIIQREIEYAQSVDNYSILFADVCNWQKELFEYKKEKIYQLQNNSDDKLKEKAIGLPNQHINLGLRQVSVKVGRWTPPGPIFLEELKSMNFPISVEIVKSLCDSDEDVRLYLTDWYKIFQTIHMFEDFNGRLGGIVINILSYIVNGHYLIRL
jgi:hypothetical protein